MNPVSTFSKQATKPHFRGMTESRTAGKAKTKLTGQSLEMMMKLAVSDLLFLDLIAALSLDRVKTKKKKPRSKQGPQTCLSTLYGSFPAPWRALRHPFLKDLWLFQRLL